MIGNAAYNGFILGSTTPLQVSGSFNSYLQNVCWNTSAGSNASCEMVFNNNLSTDVAYYASCGINGGNYGQALLPLDRPNDMFCTVSDGGIGFYSASTTLSSASSSIFFATRGVKRVELFGDGRLVMGTSSPAAAVFTIASSTGPQMVLSDGSGNVPWAFRAVSTNLFFATTTASATSTSYSMFMDGVTGSTTIPRLSLLAPLLAGNGGTGATALGLAFSVVSNAFCENITKSFTLTSTTTAWGYGTTTKGLENFMRATTLKGVRASTDASSLALDFYQGSSHLNWIANASSTNNYNTFTSNTSMAAGNFLKVDVGSSTSLAKTITFTLDMQICQ
ncbi:hypothetical protein ACVWZV_002216 [Bradyrhizobium sp. GM5.1]